MTYCRKQKTSPDLILFGGSFDPPHRGHLGCVELALQRFPTAKLWVLPAFQPASAAGQTKAPQACFEQRRTMCELMFTAHLPSDQAARLCISSLEASLPSPNLTFNTLQAVNQQAAGPKLRLCFLIGQDQWLHFPRWAYPREILGLSSLLIVKRREEALPESTLSEQIATGLTQLGLAFSWQGDDCVVLPELGTYIYLIDLAPSMATSTQVRQCWQGRQLIPEEWLTREVKEYIDQQQLYRDVKG